MLPFRQSVTQREREREREREGERERERDLLHSTTIQALVYFINVLLIETGKGDDMT